MTAIAVVAPAGTVMAGDWEIEVHGGVLWTLTPSGGQATTLPSAQPFPTVVPGVSSRRVTSWYFGDGGMLLRQTRTASGSSGSYTYQYPVSVGSLDPVLSSAAVGQPFGGGAGLRLGRRLGRRLTAEIDVEYGGHSPAFSESARADIESSRQSFGDTWSGVLSSLPGSGATSLATLGEGTGHQLVATAVLNLNLVTGDAPKWSRRPASRRFVSYVTFGAGVVSTGGAEASATLLGRYQFASPDGSAPFHETDTVTVRSSGTVGTTFVGVVGVGWKQDLSTRWGLRFDARAYLSRNTTRIALDARPSVTPGGPPSAYVTPSKIGAIQFVNDSSGPYAGDPSSLSGPAIAGLETFTGTGMVARINITVGVFLRF